VTTISFARGIPGPECLPVEELAECAHAALARDGRTILSYGSAGGYARLREWLHMPVVKALSTLLLWGYLQHLLGGLRFLLLDIHVGTALATARKLSAVTLLASSLLTLVIAGRWLW